MERKCLSFLLMFVVIGLLSGHSNAFFNQAVFKKCMSACISSCFVPPWKISCAIACLPNCYIFASGKRPPAAITQDLKNGPPAAITQELKNGPPAASSLDFCATGCAISKCTKLISKDNYRLDEVGDCVEGCSQECVNNYKLAN